MAELKDLVGELLSLNAENLAQRCIDNTDVEWCLSELMDMLTADMETVTRCKDCKHWTKGGFKGGSDPNHLQFGGSCPLSRFTRYENDFCSCGERREHE